MCDNCKKREQAYRDRAEARKRLGAAKRAVEAVGKRLNAEGESVSLYENLDDAPTAEISPCGNYRYTLTRKWADGNCVAFLMFNPSTADARVDDHTIRKCVGFANRWGYGRMVVVNLYAIRSRDPKTVDRMPETQAIGPLNNYWIQEACKEAREVICAWGCAEHAMGINERIRVVMGIIEEHCFSTPINCLGYRKADGHPRHPLTLAYTTPREEYFFAKVKDRMEREGINAQDIADSLPPRQGHEGVR